MTRRPLLVAALVVSTAACAPADPVVAENDQQILGGTSDAGKDLGLALLLVRLANRQLHHSCSAAMLTRRVVMTAAHCADDSTWLIEAWYADAYNVETGELTAPVDLTKRVAVARWVDPQWGGETSLGKGHDIALLLLDKPIPASVSPLPWNRRRLDSGFVGKTLRIAGFGDRVHDSDDPNYIKMTATNNVSQVDPSEVRIEGITKILGNGDSGGPAFLTIDGREVVAGVASYGIPGLTPEVSAFVRVDLHLDDIDAFIAANDPQSATGCGDDGECGYACTDIDPDCPCVGDGMCTAACAEPDSDPDCPLNCGPDGTCVREGCAEKDPDCGDSPIGATCGGSNECSSGLCVASSAARICSVTCDAQGACPTGYGCVAATTTCLPSASGGGGCSTAAGARGGAGTILLGLAALLSAAARRGRRTPSS